MTQPLPLACTLGADALPRRLAELSALGRDGLLAVERSGGRALLRFRPGAAIRARVDAAAAAEADCCAFLSIRVAALPDATLLTIDAPPAAEAVLDALVDAFAPG